MSRRPGKHSGPFLFRVAAEPAEHFHSHPAVVIGALPGIHDRLVSRDKALMDQPVPFARRAPVHDMVAAPRPPDPSASGGSAR